MRRIDRGDLGRVGCAIAAVLSHAPLLPGGTMACIAATAKSLLIALDCRAMNALAPVGLRTAPVALRLVGLAALADGLCHGTGGDKFHRALFRPRGPLPRRSISGGRKERCSCDQGSSASG